MKTLIFSNKRSRTAAFLAIGMLGWALLSPSISAQDAPVKGGQKQVELSKPAPNSPPEPPPRFQAPPAPQPVPPAGGGFVYEQRAVPSMGPLVTKEQANLIIQRFAKAYPNMGKPRFLIYVNRELIDETSGLKLIARTEKSVTKTESSKGKNLKKVNSENRYSNEARPTTSLTDKQTVRDIERLFGRPLRMGTAKLADQRVATQLIPSKSFQSLTQEGAQATRDREAVSKIADAVIEVLISSKEITVPTFNGSNVFAVPDIQATAINLKDASILAQASSADLLGASPSPVAASKYGVHEITEATALALMEDMLTGTPTAPPTVPAQLRGGVE